MLKKGFLATNTIYVSISHSDVILKKYFKNLDLVFKLIKKFKTKQDVLMALEGPVAISKFTRLN